MPDWKSILSSVASEIGARIRAADGHIYRAGAGDPIEIAAFRGYGTSSRCVILGRVLENEGIGQAAAEDGAIRNLVATLKRLESDEIPRARLRVRFAGVEQEVTADDEGYFELWLEPRDTLPADRQWHEAELELLEPVRRGTPPARATASVLVPPPSAELGVISDIDDTVLQSDVTDLPRMARTMLLGNARTRLPFPGVAAFYQALVRGPHGRAGNPVFFVSSSPWNLHDLLVDFFDFQEIPRGPLILRDWDFTLQRPRHGTHKHAAIKRVLELYPDLPFILIGDSGQEDPEIYREVVSRYPKRILAVYIRNVTPRPERSESIRKLAAEVADAGSTLILADDTLAAARHAAERGWIAPDTLAAIQTQKRQDESGKAGTPVTEASEPQPKTETVVVEGKGADGLTG